MTRGVGDTYLIESSPVRYILRIYRASHRNLQQIKEEVNLLLKLKESDIPVSYPISDLDGKYIQALRAAEGERFGVIFSYAPGKSVRILNERQLRSLGREMARFHNVSSSITSSTKRWNFDLETTLFDPLGKLKYVFEENPDDYAWLCKMADFVAEKLSKVDSSKFSIGYCHFDFLPKNFHFEEDSVTFFDFDFMGYGWLVNDVMTFWQNLKLDVFTGRMTQEDADSAYSIFLKAYLEYRSLSHEELEIIPYISLGFWLFYMSFHTTHDQFFVFTQPSHLKFITTLIRQIVDRYWENEN